MRNSFILTLALIISFTSCQSNRTASRLNSDDGRFIANAQTFRKFLSSVAKNSDSTVQGMEKKIIQHIQARSGNGKYGNWESLGISESQAKKIKSLDDSLPYMPKVKKWVTENITTIAKSIDSKIAGEIFESIINKAGAKRLNPYTASPSGTSVVGRQRSSSPFPTVDAKTTQLRTSLREIAKKDRSIASLYTKNLVTMKKRATASPTMYANGQEIVESAAYITKITGRKAMGEGCVAFNKSVSADVLSIKANVDVRAAEIVKEMAENKATVKSFASVDDIPVGQRLTEADIDTARARAFEDVLGYSDDEARAAVQRLKNKPCKIY